MSRFYFDMQTSSGIRTDDFGDSFDHVEDAEVQAMALVSDLLSEQSACRGDRTLVCQVRSEEGNVVFEARCSLLGKRLFTSDEAASAIDGPLDRSDALTSASEGWIFEKTFSRR